MLVFLLWSDIRSVLVSVYDFCKANLKTGQSVLAAHPDVRISSPTEIRTVINFAEPTPSGPVIVEQLD